MTPTEGPGLSLTEWVVLSLLAEAPAHGFALARTLSRAPPLLAEQQAMFAPLFERLAEQVEGDEGERVVASWRYESSQAVARLLDSLQTLDKAEAATPGR